MCYHFSVMYSESQHQGTLHPLVSVVNQHLIKEREATMRLSFHTGIQFFFSFTFSICRFASLVLVFFFSWKTNSCFFPPFVTKAQNTASIFRMETVISVISCPWSTLCQDESLTLHSADKTVETTSLFTVNLRETSTVSADRQLTSMKTQIINMLRA